MEHIALDLIITVVFIIYIHWVYKAFVDGIKRKQSIIISILEKIYEINIMQTKLLEREKEVERRK